MDRPSAPGRGAGLARARDGPARAVAALGVPRLAVPGPQHQRGGGEPILQPVDLST